MFVKNNNLTKGLFVLLIILMILILPTTSAVFIQSVKDTNKEDTLYVGGSGYGNYSSITDAIKDAKDGDTVFVYDESSPYYENILVNKIINLIGENKETTIIDARKNGSAVHLESSGVYITGFTMKNASDLHGGIFVRSDNNKIIDNIISENLFYGIELLKSLNNNISQNELENNGNIGIVLFHSNHNSIIGNNLTGNSRAMDLYYSSYNKIAENIFDDNYFTLGLYWGYSTESSSHNTIKKNTVSNNYGGIEIWGKSEGYLSDNVIIENNVSNNEVGISFNPYTSGNIVYHNNLVNNTNSFTGEPNNAYDFGENQWDNGEEGNYWSDYREKYPNAVKKRGKPWIWNNPYNIQGFDNEDRYPLVDEWPKIKSKVLPVNRISMLKSIFLETYENIFTFLKILNLF